MKGSYVRYTVPYLNGQTNRPQGLLGAAFKLSRSAELHESDRHQLMPLLERFQSDLKTPEIFHIERNKQTLSWFKDTAGEFTVLAEAVMHIVEQYLDPINVESTDDIGLIVYEDEHQVLAIPKNVTPA